MGLVSSISAYYSTEIFLDKSITKRCCWVFVECIECVTFSCGFIFSQHNSEYIDDIVLWWRKERGRDNYSKTHREGSCFH